MTGPVPALDELARRGVGEVDDRGTVVGHTSKPRAKANVRPARTSSSVEGRREVVAKRRAKVAPASLAGRWTAIGAPVASGTTSVASSRSPSTVSSWP